MHISEKGIKLVITVVICLPWLLGASRPRIITGPETMPNVDLKMQGAEYWIARLSDPDQILISAKQAEMQTRRWEAEGILINIFALPENLLRQTLQEWLVRDFSYLHRVARYKEDGSRLQKQDYQRIKKNVNLTGLQGSNSVKWGLTVRMTVLRLFPTEEIATVKPLDVEFNVLLHSGLRLAEPLAILHNSADKKWLYVATAIGRGWVKAEDVGQAESRMALIAYIRKARNIVIGKELNFQTPAGQLLPDKARMGCQLAFFQDSKKSLAFPRNDAEGKLYFIEALPRSVEAIHCGPRPCTARVILEQAFIWLHVAYGWGGDSGYGDCSEFIRRVGLTCGLNLPRSTTGLKSGLINRVLPSQSREKQRMLSRLTGGSCLLYLPGHVMLVLGTVAGRTYVIHNLYGIHGQDTKGDFIKRIARVVVSDLSLGAGSRKGSLLERVNSILFFGHELDKAWAFE